MSTQPRLKKHFFVKLRLFLDLKIYYPDKNNLILWKYIQAKLMLCRHCSWFSWLWPLSFKVILIFKVCLICLLLFCIILFWILFLPWIVVICLKLRILGRLCGRDLVPMAIFNFNFSEKKLGFIYGLNFVRKREKMLCMCKMTCKKSYNNKWNINGICNEQLHYNCHQQLLTLIFKT